MKVVVALGGNALLPRGEVPDAAAQVARVARAAPTLAAVAAEHEVVLVHGNGPQVGMLALETAADAGLSRPYPFSELVAETQGLIGYWLQQGLVNAGLRTPVVTLVTQTLVAADDPAFADPTKFVGAVYDEARAHELAAREGWTVKPDGDGWRRVVASPLPSGVLEVDTARLLLEHGTTVVLAGGGGVPVVEGAHGLAGVDAVVDKDFVAALVATRLGAEVLVLLTDVPAVMTGWGTPDQHPLRDVRAADLTPDEFPAGWMGPKVAAAAAFVADTGGRAAIGALDDAAAVVAGTAGTQLR
ncbi:carbamate kinase [Nocardioides sp. AX2bis]|uniref:carbamate kinase n=1 Tax=Nocardioides sp. AX2bis TaxID=2653157 RepID=UPI0012F4730D|nr:carbamate kinase [Nocardioides sp. AX2bis]VXC46266.1 Carbamate kinase [Nocardioides sp. AX2bis]